ncbi:unnamed protein product [Eruca vesicaria subsp. sativa]|uniref:DC1 domain-containing protein n=1 Tax=Eruca vesicaria subsp. sativa TaxID=29727 RepID=A0ABC8L6C8_ERUVS|nr:unnamed protein product [Eruca vesicaria subsp. sativa]
MAPVNEYVDLFWHDHPLCYKVDLIADGCEECHKSTGNFVAWSPLYECSVCKKRWHPSCVPSSPVSIRHPCHISHFLELCLQGLPNYANWKCSLCQQTLSSFIYHCKLCDFRVDMNCAKMTMDSLSWGGMSPSHVTLVVHMVSETLMYVFHALSCFIMIVLI